MSEYTQEGFEADTKLLRSWCSEGGCEAEFDNLIAEVERRASEKAWDTGVSDFQQAHGMDSAEPWPYLRDNPYRRNEGEK